MRHVSFTLLPCLLWLAGCGGREVVDATPSDATVPVDGDSDAAADAVGDAGDAAVGADADADADAAYPLRPCKDQQDCWGEATCQRGFCCNGILDDAGSCTCFGNPGCDVRSCCSCQRKRCAPAIVCINENCW